MRNDKESARAFTLVELLVVIGIIALLIAILMPALSRARKQALQVSCGSNERQMTYAAIAYANDWKEQLPRVHELPLPNWFELWRWIRLPIIGFDTGTIWNMATYASIDSRFTPATGYDPVGPGGWAFMMRDYLKNDWDIWVCPDGWWDRSTMLTKWDGCTGSCLWNILVKDDGSTGYGWLPHRVNSYSPCSEGTYAVIPDDKPRKIAKTASDKPDLLVCIDYIHGHGASAPWGGPPVCLSGNHMASPVDRLPRDYPCINWPHYNPLQREVNNPEDMPLGSNRSRIDCRTTWTPFQDLPTITWCVGSNFFWIW